MKKVIFTLAIMFSAVVGVNAQDTGKIWVGGSAGFNSTKTEGADRLNQYNITPEVGYIISDKIGVGIKLGYNHSESMESFSSNGVLGSHKEKYDGFEVAPFVRYAILKGDIGGLFVDGGVGYVHQKAKEAGTKLDMFEVGFRPGVSLNVSDKVSIIGTFGHLGYQHEKWGDSKTDSFGFDLSLDQIQFGVNFIF